jgi:hypothetical protein
VAVAGGDEAKLAADALGRLPDAEVDSELIASLKGDSDVPTKSVAVAVLARRGCAAAIPAMADVIASAADSGLSRDCWKALRDLTPGKASEFARLLALLPGVSDRSELRDAERTLSTVAGKVADTTARDELIVATLGKTKGPAKATAIDLAGKFPAPASLAVLTESLKDPEEAVQYAAVKALMDWSDSAPAPALLAFAKDTPSVSHHALAIRGYVRLVSTAAASEDELKTKLNAAMDIARRDEDKALIKAAMSSLRITDLKAKNGKLYELVPKGFQKGGLVYIDRAYVFTDIPEFLATADLIKTSMMDRGERAKDQTTFHINRPATIVVCYDGRAKTCPGWLKDWKKLGQRISTTDGACKLELYAKAFPAGKVEINGNSPVPDVSANHIIGVTSAPIP